VNEDKIDKDKLVKHWVDSSDANYNSMLVNYKTKEYNWALFIGHLCIEKLLKALFVKVNDKFPPLIHDLIRLAEKSNLPLNEEQEDLLREITTFNLEGRYEDYQQGFYKLCTPEYTTHWIEKIKMTRTWIKELIAK